MFKPVLHFLFTLVFFFPLLAKDKMTIRVGHFPNINHAQGLIGHGLTREHKGWFEKRLGENIEVQWFIYNAGPSAMEAIFADSLDLTYVGPSSTINAYIRSKGESLQIIAGSCSGGASLVIQSDSLIKKNSDFKGKKMGTPQLGSTQDIAARSWLKSNGLRVTLTGGDVYVIPTENADQLLLFEKKGLDAVWTVEPWVSQLVLRGKGKVYLEESSLWPETNGNYTTTHLVCSKKFLNSYPDLSKKWVEAHVELTEWIKYHPIEAKQLVNQEIKAETTRFLAEDVLERAWNQITITYDPLQESLFKYAEQAYQIGFLKKKPNLAEIYDLQYLREVIKEKKLPRIES
jgi:NitT/TauT family transport system substrate-binding protein